MFIYRERNTPIIKWDIIVKISYRFNLHKLYKEKSPTATLPKQVILLNVKSDVNSYFGITDFPLTDVGINGQNLEQPIQFVSTARYWRICGNTGYKPLFTPVEPELAGCHFVFTSVITRVAYFSKGFPPFLSTGFFKWFYIHYFP